MGGNPHGPESEPTEFSDYPLDNNWKLSFLFLSSRDKNPCLPGAGLGCVFLFNLPAHLWGRSTKCSHFNNDDTESAMRNNSLWEWQSRSYPILFLCLKPLLFLTYTFPSLNTVQPHTDGNKPFKNSNSISKDSKTMSLLCSLQQKALLLGENFQQARISLSNLSNLEITENNFEHNTNGKT